MSATTTGISEAAKILADTQRRIERHCDLPVTLSRRDAEDAVWEAWQATAEEWQISDSETAITPEVRDTAIRFLELLPLGFPQPNVCGEPDGHISLEWYRNPHRIVSVSIGPANQLHWAALIGSESPRGSIRFFDRIPETIRYYIARVFQG